MKNFKTMRDHLIPLDLGKSHPLSPIQQSYLRFYNLPWQNANYQLGTVESGAYHIATHVIRHPQAAGTVFYLHGYVDHVGSAHHLIHFFVKKGYNVVMFDLPGHGLSSGPRGTIQQFSDYVAAFEAVLSLCANALPTPFYAVGHSLGAAILQTHAMLPPASLYFKKVVLLAPLVKIKGFGFIRYKYYVLKCCSSHIPRVFRNNSSDKTFLKEVKQDPLQLTRVPLSWLQAYYRWFDAFAKTGTCQQAATFIQGTQDGTLDWQYNLSFLQKKFPRAKSVRIEGAEHHLPAEGEPLRTQIFSAIQKALADGV